MLIQNAFLKISLSHQTTAGQTEETDISDEGDLEHNTDNFKFY